MWYNKHMVNKDYSLFAGVIFAIIAVLHVLRIVFGWEAMIAGWSVPMWLSWIALLIAGYLGYTGFMLSRKR